MSGTSQLLARFLVVALTLGVVLPFSGSVILYPTEAVAKTLKKSTLPKPYVSKALKAVLMPVTQEVARKFKLAKGSKGVMVVSVKPDGIGKLAGLKPGDVISTILGQQVRKPSDVDTIIAYFLSGGTTDYRIAGTRKGGRTYRATTYITPDYFYEPIDVYTLTSWSSFSYQTYSYTEYVSYYAQDIYTSYERSETYIEETITETSFVSEMTSETNYEYSSYDEEVVDGSYVEGGTGSVWQDGETDVFYDPADDAALLEEPLDSVADDVDPFTADQGDPDYETAAAEADAGDASDPTLYDEASTSAPDEAALDPNASEDMPVAEDAASEDPGASEDPAPAEGLNASEEPGASEDSSMAEDPQANEDPPATDDPSAYEDLAPREDQTYEDPPPEDQGSTEQPADEASMDDASGGDPICTGEIIDGACVQPSYDAGGGEAGGGEEFIPEQ